MFFWCCIQSWEREWLFISGGIPKSAPIKCQISQVGKLVVMFLSTKKREVLRRMFLCKKEALGPPILKWEVVVWDSFLGYGSLLLLLFLSQYNVRQSDIIKSLLPSPQTHLIFPQDLFSLYNFFPINNLFLQDLPNSL